MNKIIWNDIWRDYSGLNFLGRMHKRSQFNQLNKILKKLNMKKTATIIDVGCGSGQTLKFFRLLGFPKSIGIDISKNSINLCKKAGFYEGKDVFQKDVNVVKGKFDLVFSDGLLEHFQNPQPIVDSLCRLSKQYVLLFQPNPFSLIGRLKNISERLGHSSWEKEYEYSKKDYEYMFKKAGFVLKESGNFHFNESIYLLFKRCCK